MSIPLVRRRSRTCTVAIVCRFLTITTVTQVLQHTLRLHSLEWNGLRQELGALKVNAVRRNWFAAEPVVTQRDHTGRQRVITAV